MNIKKLTNNLLSQTERNESLTYLYQNELVPNDELILAMVTVIHEPDSIEDTHAYASLLSDMNHDAFIAPLIKVISTDISALSNWLADYMYALINLLNQSEETFQVSDDFIDLLANWVLNTQGGEVSWKASDILSEVENKNSKPHLIKAALDDSLFHLTRINCLKGMVNHFREGAPELITSLLETQDEEVKEAARMAQIFLNKS